MNTETISTDVDPAAYVEAVVRRAGSSFYWAMRRLPAHKRHAMYAIYAFCREVDDIADEGGTAEEKRNALGLWRGDIERLFGDRPRNTTALALQRPVEEFGLKKEDFRAVIDGMEMDADGDIRITDMDELTLYCDRVACAVGRLSACVFGLEDALGQRLAFHQGLALQLTNILRDIAEDAERGRLYIPRDLLVSYDINTEDLPSILSHPAFPKVCETLSDVAARHFSLADATAAECDPEQIRPAIMMMEIYRRIFFNLQHRGWQNLHMPVKLSKIVKIMVALRYGVF